MKRIISSKVDKQIVELYKEGYTICDIAMKLGISKSSVSARIPEEFRIGKGRSRPAEEKPLDKEKCIALLRAGWNMEDIRAEAELDLKRDLYPEESKWLSDLVQAILNYRLAQLAV